MCATNMRDRFPRSKISVEVINLKPIMCAIKFSCRAQMILEVIHMYRLIIAVWDEVQQSRLCTCQVALEALLKSVIELDANARCCLLHAPFRSQERIARPTPFHYSSQRVWRHTSKKLEASGEDFFCLRFE